MKRTIIIIAIILVSLNAICGAIISAYEWLNVLFSSATIILMAVFIWAAVILPLKDGFKVSLPFIFLFCGIAEFILCTVSEQTVQDNPNIVSVIAIIAFQLILLIICTAISKIRQ